jgi:hypothetical protein
MRVVVFILLIGCCFTLAAQRQVSGRVLDALSKAPVASANVFLASTSIGTTTREQGTFLISQLPQGSYDLVVSCIGYETYTRTIRSGDLPLNLQVELKPKTQTLREVVVSSDRSAAGKNGGISFSNILLALLIILKTCTCKTKMSWFSILTATQTGFGLQRGNRC